MLSGASLIIKDQKMRDKISAIMENLKYPFAHAFVEGVTIAAYTKSVEWLEAVKYYIQENKRIFKEYFETHQKGKLYLTDATRKIRFFACMKVTAADAKIYHPDGYRKENLKDLLDYIQANAVQYRDVNVADENSLIALSTCSEAETNGRVVLIGKLERKVAEKQ